MAAADPAIRTLRLTRIPLWLSQESDSAIVVPGVVESIERAVGVPTDGVTYTPDRHDDIRVQFLTRESAMYVMYFYRKPENLLQFSMEWSTYNISPEFGPPPGACPVSYRFPERDIPSVFPQDKPPEPVHPADPSWFCRYNPLQVEIGRQVHYMWSPWAQQTQNYTSPQAYVLVPPQPPPSGLLQPQQRRLSPQQQRLPQPQPQQQRLPQPQQRRLSPQQQRLPQPQQQRLPQPQQWRSFGTHHRQRTYQRHQQHQQPALAPRPLSPLQHYPQHRQHPYQRHPRQQPKPHKRR